MLDHVCLRDVMTYMEWGWGSVEMLRVGEDRHKLATNEASMLSIPEIY